MLKLTNLSKTYNSNALFQDFSFEFEEGFVYTIFGPNGCGKSTLLNILAGFDDEYSGQIQSSFTNTNFVFQNYNESIMSWLSVFENIGLGLLNQNNSKVSEQIRNVKITKLLKAANIEHLHSQKASSLSGGQKQLVCILRSLINEPELLLMDEPFSAIDYLNSNRLYDVLKVLIESQSKPPTCIIVTHDPIESILLGNKVIVIGKNFQTQIIDVTNISNLQDPILPIIQNQILSWITKDNHQSSN
jgi:ABC-type nitrate/sulfonate/bicarbonate transport system ATPase subunit